MKTFKNILFPVDFSEVCPQIAPWVLTMATKFGTAIHLVFVARRLEYFSSVYVSRGTIEDFEAEVIRGAEKMIEEFADAHFKGHPDCKTRVLLGDAA